MFGHRWERAEATIVLSHVKKTSGDGMVSIHEYVADVRPSAAAPFRATIQEPRIATDFWPPSIGDVVGVLVDAKDGSVKFDKDDPRISAKARKIEQQRRFEQIGTEAPGSFPAPAGGLPAAFTAVGFTTIDVASAGFTQVELPAAAMDALREALQGHVAPSSTDPAERLAKVDALHARGLLSDEEHAATRQRILDAI